MNPFGICGHWKIDPDGRQDRGSGTCTKRPMTPKEIDKYGSVARCENKPSTLASVPGMVRKDIFMKNKINKDKLLEICGEHGFTKAAYGMAATEFGVSVNSIQTYVSKNKLHKESAIDGSLQTAQPSVSAPNFKGEPEDTSNIELEIIDKIKAIIDENRNYRDKLSQIKTALEEIIKTIA